MPERNASAADTRTVTTPPATSETTTVRAPSRTGSTGTRAPSRYETPTRTASRSDDPDVMLSAGLPRKACLPASMRWTSRSELPAT